MNEEMNMPELTLTPNAAAAASSTPCTDARSITKQPVSRFSSNFLFIMREGMVLNTTGNRSSSGPISPVSTACHPKASIQVRSSGLRAVAVTRLPRPCSRKDSSFPMRPNPSTRHSVPSKVRSRCSMAT